VVGCSVQRAVVPHFEVASTGHTSVIQLPRDLAGTGPWVVGILLYKNTLVQGNAYRKHQKEKRNGKQSLLQCCQLAPEHTALPKHVKIYEVHNKYATEMRKKKTKLLTNQDKGTQLDL
jgi:hypothetical protein